MTQEVTTVEEATADIDLVTQKADYEKSTFTDLENSYVIWKEDVKFYPTIVSSVAGIFTFLATVAYCLLRLRRRPKAGCSPQNGRR